jgi:hypothetical protein
MRKWRCLICDFEYDEAKGLLRVGYTPQDKAPDPNHYGDYLSEARVAYLVAIAHGDVPPESWSRLDRGGSLDGGAMDHLAPLIFVEEAGLDDAVRKQVGDPEVLGGRSVWGKGEAAYLEKDETGRWRHRYGRFGAAGLAADVHDVGPGHLAVPGERVGRRVEDAHDQGALELEHVVAQSQPHAATAATRMPSASAVSRHAASSAGLRKPAVVSSFGPQCSSHR